MSSAARIGFEPMSYRDSKSRRPYQQSNLAMAPGQGNDPRSLESESSVMPLDQPGVGMVGFEPTTATVSEWNSYR